MGEDLYTMAGTVKIPDNRKAEFNDSVLKLLYWAGSGKRRKWSWAEKRLPS